MRLVERTGPGVVEISYMWLPTFIGLNSVMMEAIQNQLNPFLVSKELTDDVLNEAHDRVLDIICQMHPLPGLRDYLDALKFVEG